MVFFSMAGKTFIKGYRMYKGYNTMGVKGLGKFYKGGFKHPMTVQEAALILGVK